MIKYLEELLYQKTKDSQSEILFAQWNYDKKVIPAALQSVSNLFPHYSLHDESHSITIINNIVRVIGQENIEKLSAIDIWFILEASYCHDIGMVVSGDVLKESLVSAKFIEFFKDLLQDTKSGLYEFASRFYIEGEQIKINSDIFDLELSDGIKFILAEYFRRIHADRSREIIVNPNHELFISSPRAVIPPRIFKILGDICSCHTKNFEDVLKLPFCEVGIDVENAHPRFIACLLRIGDLLDLDNNRFSEVMLRTLTRIPVDTLNHKAKHLSIESYRVDKDKIEITAKCKDYETANITQHWFNFLNSEISQQMINWNDIVPFKELCYLPTIGKLKVELLDYNYIDGKNKPKFSVDTDKALALLQGAGIYKGASQSIREILQNAVDSVLLKIWLDHKDEFSFDVPSSSEFTELVKNYPISVTIQKLAAEAPWQNWQIMIEDKGIGISSEDLKFLMKTGSSSRNKLKHSIIDSMPLWMRPSGTFGIGFQSVFMLTECVKIETKNYFDEQFQIIELNSPNSKRDGDILIQQKKTNHGTKPGAKISFNYKTSIIPDNYSIKFNSEAGRIINMYDPFSHESIDVEIGHIIDEVLEFANKCYLPILLKVDDDEIKFGGLEGNTFEFFDNENSLELNINPNGRGRISTFYKNQNADNKISISFLHIEVNIHKDKASEVLTLNRNEIRSEYLNKLEEDVFNSAFKIIIAHFDEIFESEDEKSIGSMFLNFYLEDSTFSEQDISRFDQWGNYHIDVDGKGAKISEIISQTTALVLKVDNRYSSARERQGDLYSFKDNTLTIEFTRGIATYDVSTFMIWKLSTKLKSIDSIDEPVSGLYVYKYSTQNQTVKIDKTVEILNKARGSMFTARSFIPCPDEFQVLQVREQSKIPYVRSFSLESNLRLPYPKMLSPFIKEAHNGYYRFKPHLNDKLFDWVFEHRNNHTVTREEIVSGYSAFCETVKDMIIEHDEPSF